MPKLGEPRVIRRLLKKLRVAPLTPFPPPRKRVTAPEEHGVYIIYSPRRREVLHVGRTYRGGGGLRKRPQNYLHGASSFTHTHLSGDRAKLRHGYAFRCLAVKRARQRALLEFYATGWLCPAHLGTHVGDD
jgi:hypothetical protein